MPLHDTRPGCRGLIGTEEGLKSIEKAARRKPLFVSCVNVTAYIGVIRIASYLRRSNSYELEFSSRAMIAFLDSRDEK